MGCVQNYCPTFRGRLRQLLAFVLPLLVIFFFTSNFVASGGWASDPICLNLESGRASDGTQYPLRLLAANAEQMDAIDRNNFSTLPIFLRRVSSSNSEPKQWRFLHLPDHWTHPPKVNGLHVHNSIRMPIDRISYFVPFFSCANGCIGYAVLPNPTGSVVQPFAFKSWAYIPSRWLSTELVSNVSTGTSFSFEATQRSANVGDNTELVISFFDDWVFNRAINSRSYFTDTEDRNLLLELQSNFAPKEDGLKAAPFFKMGRYGIEVASDPAAKMCLRHGRLN